MLTSLQYHKKELSAMAMGNGENKEYVFSFYSPLIMILPHLVKFRLDDVKNRIAWKERPFDSLRLSS